MSLNKSQDQQVRSAVVKCGKELLERPINQLVPLECPELNDNASLDELQQLATIPQPTVPPILFNENSERMASTTSHFSTTSPQPMHFSQQLQ
uniref:Uncharacterized protein n=2 Tax=Caenorhabditis japonica TaxID=281687 RepID=A0A8R1IZI3_CAEJA